MAKVLLNYSFHYQFFLADGITESQHPVNRVGNDIKHSVQINIFLVKGFYYSYTQHWYDTYLNRRGLFVELLHHDQMPELFTRLNRECIVSLSRRDFLISTAGAVVTGCSLLSFPAISLAASITSLEYKINKAVKTMRNSGIISSNECTSWSIFDFTSGQKLVSINEDRPMQAASMIKPFVAQAFFIRHNSNPKLYPYTSKEKQILERMLRYSDNTATNQMINIVGKQSKQSHRPVTVERVLKSFKPALFRQTSIVEYIPPGGQTYRNSASAHDYSRFLFAMWKQNLPHVEEIQYYMSLSNRDRITTGVRNIPASVKVIDKTGSTSQMCGDMGIVVAHDKRGKLYPYTFIGMIERDQPAKPYTQWIRTRGNVLRKISGLAYDHFKATYRL